jgi:hypothetical protein
MLPRIRTPERKQYKKITFTYFVVSLPRLRAEADQAAIFAAYEELVTYAAQNLSVVTSEDIVNLAQQKP